MTRLILKSSLERGLMEFTPPPFSVALMSPQIARNGRLGFLKKIRLVLVGKPRRRRLNRLFGLLKLLKLQDRMDYMQSFFKDFG